MATLQTPNLVNSSTPSGQSPLLNGINAAGGWGKALSGLVQLPGAMWNSFAAGQQAANAKNAATGQPYQIPGGIGIAQNAKALAATNANKPTPTSGIIPVANAQTNPPAGGTGTGTDNTPIVQPDPNAAAANTYNGGVNGNGQTFPGYVSALANTASSATPNYTSSTNTAQTAANKLLTAVPSQNENVKTATNNIQALQNEYANQTGIIGNSPIGLSEQGGEQGLINTQYASKLSAAETALSNALQGNTQEQAAYTGAGNLANTTAGNATTQQGTQQSGQSAAAGLVQPTAANPYGVYQPATGATEGYGTGAGSTTGGAATAGAVGTQVQQGAAVQSMKGVQAQAQSLSSTLSDAIDSSGYNPNQGLSAATTYANGINQWLQSNSGNPQYQNVANLISEVANKYAAILNQSGGTPTSVSQVQQTIINGLASGQDIKTTLGNLDENATKSIDALNTASKSNATNGTSNTSSQYNW